ncbi:MAG TPA: hypothetical protein VF508_13950, partial [Pyrinomonadaceae bacterium]
AAAGVGLAAAATPQVRTPTAPPQTAPRRFDKAEKAEHESQFPVTDYNAAEPEDPEQRGKRRARNRRYDGRGLVAKPENSGEDQATTRFDDWEVNLPPLPVAQSDAVVIGEVLDAKAYLSDDKGGVYSEFSLRADGLVLEGGGAKIAPGSTVVVEREGGRVRFPSGVVELYQVAGQGMPRVGRRYVLFLKGAGEGQSYGIVTGYEIRGGLILPLDKRGSDKSKFDAYRDMSLDAFLQAVRDAAAQSLRAQKGGG